MKKVIIVIGIILVVLIAGGVAMVSSWELPDDQIGELNLETVENGIYYGEYVAKPLKAVVVVKVQDHEIVGLGLEEHDYGFGEKAEEIIDRVMESQSLQVDIISGATHSSYTILKAIEDALTDH